MRKNIIPMIIVGLTVVLIPIVFYVGFFSSNEISSDSKDWGPFGDFFWGILNPILSTFTLIVTAFIAYELKNIEDRRSEKAIETSYKPELIIEEMHFYTYIGNFLGIEFSREKKPDDYEVPHHQSEGLGLNIFNIGLGPAKKIEIEYDLNIELAIEIINKSKHESNREDRVNVASKGRMLSFEGKNFSSTHVVGNQSKQKINHMLTVDIEKDPYVLKLPKYISQLFGAYLINEKLSQSEFPPVFILMKYSDIGGKEFVKKIEVNISCYFWSKGIETICCGGEIKIIENYT